MGSEQQPSDQQFVELWSTDVWPEQWEGRELHHACIAERWRYNVAEISGDDLDAGIGIAQLRQSVALLAEHRILATEFERNHLSRKYLVEDSTEEKRFFFLRRERKALQSFVV